MRFLVLMFAILALAVLASSASPVELIRRRHPEKPSLPTPRTITNPVQLRPHRDSDHISSKDSSKDSSSSSSDSNDRRRDNSSVHKKSKALETFQQSVAVAETTGLRRTARTRTSTRNELVAKPDTSIKKFVVAVNKEEKGRGTMEFKLAWKKSPTADCEGSSGSDGGLDQEMAGSFESCDVHHVQMSAPRPNARMAAGTSDDMQSLSAAALVFSRARTRIFSARRR
ncbi:hypothetical protein DFJ73DRAFT_965874 [Zopfochytrium polystomum]|nr:hypothetical protein DFJ73DRAFT_965874 [Zopfochytrium polystomum]